MKTAAAKGAVPDLHIAIAIKNEAAWRQAMTGVRPIVKKAVCAVLDSQPDLPAGPVQLSVLLTNDAEVRRLNKLWRGQDKPTNVLSFPADQYKPVDRKKNKESKNKKLMGKPKPILLGDVVIARETILREARSEKKTPRAHMAHLVVHGVLHLLGYDHERLKAANVMESLERQILASLKIADPYLPPVSKSPSHRARTFRTNAPRKGKAA